MSPNARCHLRVALSVNTVHMYRGHHVSMHVSSGLESLITRAVAPLTNVKWLPKVIVCTKSGIVGFGGFRVLWTSHTVTYWVVKLISESD